MLKSLTRTSASSPSVRLWLTATVFSAFFFSMSAAAERLRQTEETVKPLFPCTADMDDPYGICTHITRKWMDYPYMDEQLRLTQSLGIGWVRSDFDFGTAFGSTKDFNPWLFDDVVSSLQSHNQRLLPILTWLGRMPWDDPDYGTFVDSLTAHYDGKIKYWEMMNEVNLMHGIDSLPQKYAKAMAVAAERIHRANPENRIMLTGLGDVADDFLEQLLQLGALDDVDVMNMHSYYLPEDLILSFRKVASLMEKYNWRRPIWLTECGMNTCKDKYSAEGFYLDFLPSALRRIGIHEDKTCVGYIVDRKSGYTTLPSQQAELYLASRAKKTLPVSFDELPRLSVKKVPVLLASTDEYFPKEYFPTLVEYVRRGGTIVLSGGMPFYYDAALPCQSYIGCPVTGTSLYGQLHMSPLNDFTDPATGKFIDADHAMVKCVDESVTDYRWEINPKSPGRFLSADNLRQGDSLIALVTAGSPGKQEAVAGIYRLNSDLKGNIVFQTRMYCRPNPDKEADQARRVARIHLLSFAYGIDRVFWYNLRSREEDPYDPEDYFGLIHGDMTEKPSCQAYRTLTQMLPSGSTRPRLTVSGNVFEARWTRPDGKRVTAMWSPYAPLWRKIDRGTNAEFFDYMNQPLPKPKKGIMLTEAVVYMVEAN